MEQPQRKTWTMKHPALAKAYAVVFAVISLILLFGGVSGIEKAEEENAERLRYEKKYAERIENYVDLCARLENSITYDELWAELEERMRFLPVPIIPRVANDMVLMDVRTIDRKTFKLIADQLSDCMC